MKFIVEKNGRVFSEMALMDSLKNLYYGLEDKFYDFVDALDKSGIPLYRVVDFLDDNKIPAFPVAVALLVVVLYFVAGYGFGALAVGQGSLTLAVQNSEGMAISNAIINVSFEKEVLPPKNTAADGRVELKLPLNKAVSIEVKKVGYETKTEEFTLGKEKDETLVELKTQLVPLSKTIKLMNAGTDELVDEVVTIKFSCSPGEFTATKTTENGIVELNVPEDCGKLYAEVQGKFKSKSPSIDILSGQSFELLLAEAETGTGTANVTVFNEKDEPLLGINVALMTEQGSAYSNKTTKASGSAQFTGVPSGKYYVQLFDPNGVYAEYDGSVYGDTQEIKPEGTTEFRAKLEEKAVGAINVIVKDKATGLPIANASVSLLKDEKLVATQVTSETGQLRFPVGENVPYILNVDAQGYLLETRKNVLKSETPLELLLEEATVANSQSLTVKVLDENNKPVEDTRLSLRRNEDGIPVGEEVVTGADGVGVFNRVEEGSYYVYAYKPGYGEKRSDTVNLSTRQENKLTIILPIGSGTIQVKAFNEERQPMAGAKVKVFNYYNRKQLDEKIVDPDGLKAINVRADKTVYLTVSHSEYMPYTTSPIQMAKDVTQEVEAVLVKDIPQTEVEMTGLYLNGQPVRDSLNPGQKYLAKMLLKIPRNSTFNEAGIHLRTGADLSPIVERDPLYIRDVWSSAPRIVRGTSWNPPSGYANDAGHLTTGDAKWVESVFEPPLEGVYEMGAAVQVRETAPLGTPLELHYRGWGKTGGYVRYPSDAVLGTSEVVGERHALYANTKMFPLSAGPSNLCEDSFCYIFNIQDLSSGIQTAVVDEFPAQITGKYKLLFTLANVSDRLYPNTELKLVNENSSLAFEKYSVTSVSGAEKKGVSEGAELTVSIGNMGRDDSIIGAIEFKTKKEGLSELKLSLISEGTVVLEKYLKIDIRPAAKMEVNILPRIVVPFITNNLLVQVTDFNGLNTLSDAVVSIKKNEVEVVSGKTNSAGVFPYALASPLPGTKVNVIVEKNGFRTVEKQLTVTENILNVSPYRLSELLTIGANPSKEREITVQNLTEIPLMLTDVKSSGFFQDYIKVKLKEDYKGKQLPVDGNQSMAFLLALTEKGIKIDEPKKFEGSLDLVVSNAEFGKSWTSSVPLELRIGFGDSVDDGTCFSIYPNELDIYANTAVKSFDLTLRNDCTVSGQGVPLKKLRAKILNQTSNDLGEFEVSADLDNLPPVKLTNKSAVIANNIPQESESTIVLKFKPDALTTGESSPQIIFEAVNLTEGGEEKLDGKLKVKVRINDLTECVELVGAENLRIDSLPYDFGYGNYQSNTGYDPSKFGNQPQRYSGTVGTYEGLGRTYPYGNYNYPMYDSGYSDPNYMNAFSPAGYPSGSFGGTGTAAREFTVKNNCVSPIDVDLDPTPGLVIGEGTLGIAANSETKVRVESAYMVGQQKLIVSARVQGSREATVKIKEIPVTVENRFSLGYQDCIDISTKKLNFNDFLARPITIKVTNSCFDEGVRLLKSNNAISFTSKELIEDWSLMTHKTQTGADKRTEQVMEFEIYKKMRKGDIEKTPSFPHDPQSPFQVVGDLRFFLTSGMYRAEAPTRLIVNFTTRYGTRDTVDFPITVEDYYELADHGTRLLRTGDPSYEPHQCIRTEADLLNLKNLYAASPGHCIPVDKLEGGEYSFSTTDFKGGLFKLAQSTREGWRNGCGDGDTISDLDGESKEKNGAKVEFAVVDGGHNIRMDIDLSNWNGRRIDFDEDLYLEVTRQLPAKAGRDIRVPVKFCIEASEELAGKQPGQVFEEIVCTGASLDEYGFNKLLFTWNLNEVNHNSCQGENNYCDATQLHIALNKKAKKLLDLALNTKLAGQCEGTNCEPKTTELHRYLFEVIEVGGEKFYLSNSSSETDSQLIQSSLPEKIVNPLESLLNAAGKYREEDNKTYDSTIDATNGIITKLSEFKTSAPAQLTDAEKAKIDDILIEFDVSKTDSSSLADYLETILGAHTADNKKFYLSFEEYKNKRTTIQRETNLEILNPLQMSMEVFVGVRSRPNMDLTDKKNVIDQGKLKEGLSEWIREQLIAGYASVRLWYNDLVEFNANLIKEGYGNPDFLTDFKTQYATELTQAGTDAMQWTYTKEGLSTGTTYFTVEPGTYPTVFEFNWDNKQAKTKFASNANPLTGKFSKNPFFYLPIDGRVGLTGKQREGYGASYQTTVKDKLFFVTYDDDKLNVGVFDNLTGGIARDVTLKYRTTGKIDEKILEAKKTKQGKIEFDFAPSNATPTAISLRKKSPELLKPVGILYRYENQEAEEGRSLLNWRIEKDEIKEPGVTRTVEDKAYELGFLCEGKGDTMNYGLVFDQLKNQGEMVLRTGIFTPAEEPAKRLVFVCAKDTATIKVGENARVLEGFNDTPPMFQTNQETGGVFAFSVEKLMNGVKEGKMCLKENPEGLSFYWNKEKLFEQLPQEATATK